MTSGGLLQRDTVLDIRLLGPIGAERDGEPVSLGGPRQRAVLARLALATGPCRHGRPPRRGRLGGRPAGDGGQHAAELRLPAAPSARRPAAAAARRPGLHARRRSPAARRRPLRGPRHRGPHRAGQRSGRRPRPPRGRARRVARSGARRCRRRGLGAVGGDAVERAAHGGAGGALRRTARPRPPRRGRRRARAHRRGEPAPRGLRPAADDRPLPQRPPGRRAARVFRQTRTLLADELGLDPTPALVELQARDPQPRSRAGGAGKPVDPSRSAWPRSAEPVDERRAPSRRRRRCRCRAPVVRAASGAFVGRDRQLAQLHRIWDERHDGRDARRPARKARPAPASRASAPASPRRPTAAAPSSCGAGRRPRCSCRSSRWSRPSARSCAPSHRRHGGAWPPQRGLLALLLPELEQLVPEARLERPDPSVERYLLFETMAELLRTESAEHPLLLVLDDLQWADVPSLTMIEHVLRHEHPGRLMVVATVRVPHDEPTPDLDRWAADLARDGLLDPHHRRRSADRQRRRAAADQRVRRRRRRRSPRGDRRQRLLPHRADPAHRGGADRRAARVDPGDDRTAPGPPRPGRRARAQPGRRRRAVGDAADPRSPRPASRATSCSTPPMPRSPPGCSSRTAPGAWPCPMR